jgi:hypothetical protein
MKPHSLSLETAYVRWRASFGPFEAGCFGALCQFVRAHFDEPLDHYYREGHESLSDFPSWAFERYLLEGRGTGTGEGVP